MTTLEQCAHLCHQIYKKQEKTCACLRFGQWFCYRGSIGCMISKENRIILCFRGTDGWNDLRYNLNSVPKQWSGHFIHRGYLKAFKEIQPCIETYLRHHAKDKVVICTGHSLGGALATLVGLWLKKQPWIEKVVTITFGMPRLFMSRPKIGSTSVHVNHGNDIVYLWPPFFQPTVTLWIRREEGKKWKFWTWLKHHSIRAYWFSLLDDRVRSSSFSPPL